MRQVADFIQKQCPLMGTFDLANGLFHGARERTPLMTKQLTFQQVFRDRPAIDRDKWLFRPRPQFMQRRRQRFLPRAAVTQKQDRNVGSRQLFNIAADLQHRGIGGDDPFDRRAGRRVGEPPVFIFQPGQIQRPVNDRPQHLNIDRLFTKIVRARRDRLQGVLARTIARDHDGLGPGRKLQNFFQGREPFAHAIRIRRQPQVHDGHRRVFPFHQRDRLLARVRQQHITRGKSPTILGT